MTAVKLPKGWVGESDRKYARKFGLVDAVVYHSCLDGTFTGFLIVGRNEERVGVLSAASVRVPEYADDLEAKVLRAFDRKMKAVIRGWAK